MKEQGSDQSESEKKIEKALDRYENEGRKFYFANINFFHGFLGNFEYSGDFPTIEECATAKYLTRDDVINYERNRSENEGNYANNGFIQYLGGHIDICPYYSEAKELSSRVDLRIDSARAKMRNVGKEIDAILDRVKQGKGFNGFVLLNIESDENNNITKLTYSNDFPTASECSNYRGMSTFNIGERINSHLMGSVKFREVMELLDKDMSGPTEVRINAGRYKGIFEAHIKNSIAVCNHYDEAVKFK